MPETLWAAVETVPDTEKQVSCPCYVKIDVCEPCSLIFCKAGWWSCVYCAQLRNDSRRGKRKNSARRNGNLTAALPKGKEDQKVRASHCARSVCSGIFCFFCNEVPEPRAGEMPGPAGHVLLSENEKSRKLQHMSLLLFRFISSYFVSFP